MEMRDMNYHHRYKPRDFHFAHLLVTLRRRANLTQEEVGLKIGVANKSIRNWEGGSNYPTEAHLQELIELYFDQDVFEPGHEREEALALWEQFQKSTPRPSSLFDEQWFAALLQQAHARRASPEASSDGCEPGVSSSSSDQKAPVPLTAPETVTSGTARFLPSSPLHREDWGEALDVSSFAGREPELAHLERWVLGEPCRLVALLGMGGIGKTALATTFAHRVAAQFEVVIWRSLHLAPGLDQVMSDCLHLLVDQSTESRPQDIDQRLSLLITCLRQRRCLLVLDNVETLFQGGERAGSYRPGYEDYRSLFLRVGGSVHQSCLLLTSRETLS